jgi:hypothetical protein
MPAAQKIANGDHLVEISCHCIFDQLFCCASGLGRQLVEPLFELRAEVNRHAYRLGPGLVDVNVRISGITERPGES